MHLLILAPAVLVLGVPLGASADLASFKVALIERPAADAPAEAPHGMLELPTRALAPAGPRTLPHVAVVPAPVGLPTAAENRLRTVRPIRTDSAESAPRSPRAPPVR